MAKPTKRAVALATRLGKKASTVQGWLDREYEPAVPLKGRAEHTHYEAVQRVIGPGGLAPFQSHLMLAVQGHPTKRLRAVLGDLARLDSDEEDTQDPDELVADAMATPELGPVMTVLRRTAKSTGAPADLKARVDISGKGMDEEARQTSAHPSDADVPEVVLGSVLLPIADAVTGAREVEADDLDELGGFLDQAILAPLGVAFRRTPDDATIDLSFLRSLVGVVQGAERWLNEADPDELARGVQAAAALVDALAIIGLRFVDLGDEERWRTIGRMSPVAVPTLRLLVTVYDVFLPLLGRDAIPPPLLAFGDVLSQNRSALEERTD